MVFYRFSFCCEEITVEGSVNAGRKVDPVFETKNYYGLTGDFFSCLSDLQWNMSLRGDLRRREKSDFDLTFKNLYAC